MAQRKALTKLLAPMAASQVQRDGVASAPSQARLVSRHAAPRVVQPSPVVQPVPVVLPVAAAARSARALEQAALPGEASRPVGPAPGATQALLPASQTAPEWMAEAGSLAMPAEVMARAAGLRLAVEAPAAWAGRRMAVESGILQWWEPPQRVVAETPDLLWHRRPAPETRPAAVLVREPAVTPAGPPVAARLAPPLLLAETEGRESARSRM